MTDREYLSDVAKRILLPSLTDAAGRFFSREDYIITDQVGYILTEMEALLRPLWGIAPLLKQEELSVTVNGMTVPVGKLYREIMLLGTDPESDLLFSRFADRDKNGFANQSITEIAAYCVALCLAPEILWDPYTDEEKETVGNWIREWSVYALENSWENNHFWFPIISVTALERLGVDCGDVTETLERALSFLDGMYIGGGWYQDGCFGRFDYYLAWSHHIYPLLWSMIARDTRFYDEKRAAEYARRCEAFVPYYLRYFDSDGSCPPMGRSLSYRFAESAVFAAAALAGCEIPFGAARRALIKNVSYFDNEHNINGGIMKPGYLYPSPALAESYTSEGGSLWCAKTFLALCMDEDHPFWTASEEELPVEKGDYTVYPAAEQINMPLSADSRSGVTIYNNTSHYHQGVFGHSFNDMASFYSKFAYNSRSGFGISTPDRTSLDNMIALVTPDRSMVSHRRAIVDLGRDGNVLFSRHTPFANDPGSTVETRVIILGGSLHVRAHKITLSSTYAVREGGFSVPVRDDDFRQEGNRVTYGHLTSVIKTVASCVFTNRVEFHTPERHLLAPQSVYPVYETGDLAPGVYYTASVFYFGDKDFTELPDISLDGSILTVTYGGHTERFGLS